MMIRKKLAVLMLAGVTCLASGCGNVVKDGTEALGEGRYDAADTAFKEATENKNKEVAADGYQGLGMTYYEQKEYDKALEAFQTALDQGAEQTQELYNLTAVCAMKTEDYAKALGYFQSGIALAESKTDDETKADKTLLQEMEYNVIICYEKQADWENAKSAMEQYQTDFLEDDSVSKEAEFLQTR